MALFISSFAYLALVGPDASQASAANLPVNSLYCTLFPTTCERTSKNRSEIRHLAAIESKRLFVK
jgi:hypothetical protein